jgi:hypothetical protein
MLSRPLSCTFLPSKPPRKHESHARSHAFAGLGPNEVSEPSRESMAPSTQENVCVDAAAPARISAKLRKRGKMLPPRLGESERLRQ